MQSTLCDTYIRKFNMFFYKLVANHCGPLYLKFIYCWFLKQKYRLKVPQNHSLTTWTTIAIDDMTRKAW